MVFFFTCTIISCSAGNTANTANPGTNIVADTNNSTSLNPLITYLNESALAESALNCYQNLRTFTQDISAINNNGVVTGTIQTDVKNGCLQHDYLWNSKDNQFKIIPFVNSPYPNQSVVGARTATLSTNLISAGISFIAYTGSTQSDEYAGYNDYLSPQLIPGFNYVFGVSENGNYLVGNNLGGQPLLFNITQNNAITLNYRNRPMQQSILYSVSNSGVAVGKTASVYGDKAVGVICNESDASCDSVVDGSNPSSYIYVTLISSNGQQIYGFENTTTACRLFSVDPITHDITLLTPGYYTLDTTVTDNGIFMVSSDDNTTTGIYLPESAGQASGQIYSLASLVHHLGLYNNISTTNAFLSPNGKYLTLNVNNYGVKHIFGVKIYFPQGIAQYIKRNLTPITNNN